MHQTRSFSPLALLAASLFVVGCSDAPTLLNPGLTVLEDSGGADGVSDGVSGDDSDAGLGDRPSDGDTSPSPNDAGADGLGDTGAPLPCAVADLIQQRCGTCHGHEPLFGSPMSLVTRADLLAPAHTDPSSTAIEVALARITDDGNPMPPAPNARLTDDEIAVLQGWVEAGMPDGPACEPPASDAGLDAGLDAGTDTATDTATDTGVTADTGTVTDVGGGVDAADTTTGVDAPDVVEPVECEWEVEFRANAGGGEGDTTPYTVPMSSNHYECFYFAPEWTGDAHGLRFSTIIDDARVVHHWLLYAQEDTGAPGTRRRCSGSHADATLIAGWAPGGNDWTMPPDVGLDLPGDKTYFIEIHYSNPRRLETTDRSGVRVCGTNTLQTNTAATHWLGTESIIIIGPQDDYTTDGVCRPTLTEPAHILRSWPHMHRYGTRMFSEIVRADDTREIMLDVPFQFDNQISHETPFTIYPGDRIRTRCHYRTDSLFVTFGPDTENEMCYNFVVAWPAGAFNTGGGIRGGSDNFCLR